MFRALLQEGLLYYRCGDAWILSVSYLPTKRTRYSVICSVTLVFTIMIIFAEPSVRNITGQYVLLSSPSPPFKLSNCLAWSLPFLRLDSKSGTPNIGPRCFLNPHPDASLFLSLTVAMMSRITIHLKRFAHRPNGVIHDRNHRPFIHLLFSPDQVETIGLPSFVMPGVPSSQNVTFLKGPPNGTAVVPGNGSYLAMETFLTTTPDAEEPYLQNPQEPPGALVGDNYVVPGTG